MALAPGMRFGPYEILTPLGSGGMGDVYRACDTRLDRIVALKTLPPAFSADSLALERFQREARAIAALNHPNICTIHDVGEAGHLRFFVMELLEGETLHERLKRGPLDAPALIDVAIALAGALDAAHKKGIVHRDVKPSNVFLTPHGPKLLDFGLATNPAPSIGQASTQTTVQRLTEVGTTVGTVAYMSPEQLRADVLDARTDVFSFGSVLYEMATGTRAFPGNTYAVTVSGILERDPVPIRRSNSKLPEGLEHIVSRALEKDRELRYQSAGDLRSDLERMKRDSNAARAAAPAVGGGGGRSRRRARAAIVGALAMIVIGGAVAYRSMTSAPAIGSVAVLPFTHDSADANTESLGNGITESIINSLSELPTLRVMARNTVFRYKGREIDPRQAGRDLEVDAVLTGRVAPQGDMLDVQTELVDVSSGAQLWGQRYRRPASAVLAVQEEIARQISDTLRLNLTAGDQKRLAKRYPENTEAYRLYLRGRYYFDQRTADGIRRSIESFQEAIKKEPTYALAYAGLANAYIPSDTALPPRANVPKAKDAALRALASDESLAEVHTALGRVLQHGDLDWRGAEREFRRAIDLAPNNAEAHHMYSHYLTPMGRVEESVAEAARALALDPLDVLLNTHLAWAQLHARKYDESIVQSLKAIAMDPNIEASRTTLGRAYLGKKMFDEALSEFQKVATLSGGVATGPDTYLAYTYGLMGRKEDALQKLEVLRDRHARGMATAYDVGIVYVALGDSDRGFEWLVKACEERSGTLEALTVDVMFDPIRKDPRFSDLVARLGLPVNSGAGPFVK